MARRADVRYGRHYAQAPRFRTSFRTPSAMTASLSTPGDGGAVPPAPAAPRRGVFVLRTRRQRDRRMLAMAVAAAVIALVLVIGIMAGLGREGGGVLTWGSDKPATARLTLPGAVRDTAPIYDTAVMPIAPEEASAINAERPVDVKKVIPAAALKIARESAAGAGYGAALRCLTQAVYYEAASEPEDGQRAVAQVVLNRVRHPAFPNTVCGVVYQGSERVTGCQFSFTCDGSLARVPSVGGWSRAERIARDALGGRVAAMVGNATHYHANYVVPYWAPTLDKAATVGAHIFYLMRGFLGSPRAFTAHYDVAAEAPMTGPLVPAESVIGETLAVPDPLAAPAPLTPDSNAPREDGRAGRLIVGSVATGFEWKETSRLRADEARGELKAGPAGGLRADEGKPAAATPTPSPPPAAAKDR